MRPATFILLLAVIPAAFGCRDRQPKITYSNQWPGWVGDATIDPAGDVHKLQGKWSRVPQGEGWPEAYLVFDGDTATYEHPALGDEGRTREPGQRPYVDKYRFVLNSSIDPKVIRFVHRLGEGKPIPGHQAPQSHWYKLDGDTLTIWDHFAQQGEAPKYRYRRVKGAD